MTPSDAHPGDAHPGMPVLAFIGLGSNLQDPRRQVAEAMVALAAMPGSTLVARSRCYRTAPVGPPGQPDYVNAVAALRTALTPAALLAALHAIEIAQGRHRDGTRWGPRILDLDILTYGEERIDAPGLTIPHPEMARRAFVLIPLADVAPPDLAVPGVGLLADLLARCDPAGVEPIDGLDGLD